jgi:anti-sigma regulatory factor (Ser/Thr protein kinase)
MNAPTSETIPQNVQPPIPPALWAVRDRWPCRWGLELDDHPDAISRARKRISDVLAEWGFSSLVDDVVLVASELTANAAKSAQVHGKTDPIRLWLLANSTRVAILVSDPGAGIPQVCVAAADDESGRGLMIVEALSAQWGWDHSSAPSEGKVVWALLEITLVEPARESSMQADALFPFERTNLEKLRLACQVILDQATESFISDSLEEELYGLRDEIDRVLLLPDRPVVLG